MTSAIFLLCFAPIAEAPAQAVFGQLLPAESEPKAAARLSQDTVLQWNEIALETIKAERSSPPLVARDLAIVHTSIFDAVNAITKTHQPYRVSIAALVGTSADAAAAVAAHRALSSLYPKQRERLDAALAASLALVPDGDDKTAGIKLGKEVADKILAWRERDGAREPSAYKPREGLGRWQPTLPDYQAALLPQWTKLDCFAMREAAQFRAGGPPALDGAEFAAAYEEVKALGGTESKTRTAEQTEIARFWVCGDGTVTPPGHWNRIARQVAIQRGNSLNDNARLFAVLNVALADAGVCCWDCKYRFDLYRPVTAIREMSPRVNARLAADPNWTPLIPTPPFPAYTSGHSTFSAAGATVLANFFGKDAIRFTTTSEGLPGVTRKFNRFSDAAAEAGRSRIYGGIHYNFDDRDGKASGRALADYVLKNYFLPRDQEGMAANR